MNVAEVHAARRREHRAVCPVAVRSLLSALWWGTGRHDLIISDRGLHALTGTIIAGDMKRVVRESIIQHHDMFLHANSSAKFPRRHHAIVNMIPPATDVVAAATSTIGGKGH